MRVMPSRFNADAVVHGAADTLLAAQVALRSLDRDVPKKGLDLVQFASGGMAELRAGATEVMRSELRNPNLLRVVLHDVPDEALGDAFTPVLACATDATKHLAC